MRKRRPAGLLASGNAAANPLLRLLSASGALGPVASTSLRVASRIANALGAGTAVDDPAAFEGCRLILVHLPGEEPGGVKWLEQSQVDWVRRAVLMVEGESAGPLRSLAERGAAIGVVAALPGIGERSFLLEGERAAAGEIRPLLHACGARLTLIPPGSKAPFDAALALSGGSVFALLSAADAALRSADLPRDMADRVLEKSVERAVRSWMKARGKGWSGYVEELDPDRVKRLSELLDGHDPRAAALFRGVARAAREFMG